MDTIYLVLIIFLFVLAAFDLVVGVSNDAVNFLNSAVGSKAAPLRVVLGVAALGVFIGSMMSNGMMEIARHGIFRPENFVFADIMVILLAAMITDIFLLDIFNTLGLPTSTTVSLVFELLGATMAMAVLSVAGDPTGLLSYGDLVNTDKVLSVILGIFLSVGIAFVFGAIVQFLTRVLFTFNYKKNMKYFAAIFGGLAITCIVYFVLIKGLKDSTFMTKENLAWIKENTAMLMLGCFVIFTFVMQILYLFKINILKIIVLSGTFALALAFAGNDLVNFIGVPLAGFAAFTDYMAHGGGNIDTTLKMESLQGPATTPFYFLLAAGVIMVIALFTSKKARSVIETSVNLSRQDEGEENFNSSGMARNIVRASHKMSEWFADRIPQKASVWVNKRFDRTGISVEDDAAFDLLRASVNLILAALLIAMGTSLKLPLSTTYVTFMVAMGTSLSDRAWGRDSAVFRISGVVNVIGGWLITAVAAFMLTFVVAMIIHFGGAIAIVILGLLMIYSLIVSQRKFRKSRANKEQNQTKNKLLHATDKDEALSLLQQHAKDDMLDALEFVGENYKNTVDAFCRENLRALRTIRSQADNKRKEMKDIIRMGTLGIRKLSDSSAIERGLYYYQSNDFASELVYSLHRIVIPCEEHIDNNFNPLIDEQKADILTLVFSISTFMEQCCKMVRENDYAKLDEFVESRNTHFLEINKNKRRQLQRLQRMDEQDISTKASMVYLTILHESQNMVSFTTNLAKVNRKLQSENLQEAAWEYDEFTAQLQ